MAENLKSLELGGLRSEITDSVKLFSEKVMSSYGDNLLSVSVFGSSLTDDYVTGKSDINTVLVLGKESLDSLNTLAGMAKAMSKKKIAVPLVITPEYLESSRDVFGVEFLDLQLNHKTVYGNDPFEGLSILKSDVRLQCERELKATLIRMRQGYIASAGNMKFVRDIVISAAVGLVPLLRAMLWMKDIDRDAIAEKVLAKASAEFSFNADSLIKVLRWKHSKVSADKSEIASVFETVYANVEQLASIVDGLEV